MSDPETPEDYPFESVVSRWDRVLEDMTVTAAEYDEAGWETVELHPGNVTVTADAEDRDGVDVLVPNDEFDRLREAVADRTFDSYEVFQAVDEGVVFLLVALTDAAGEVAVFVPTYYDETDVEPLRAAVADDALAVAVRPLDDSEIVTFDLEEPEPVFPD